jgi:hypothetical protein
MPFSSSEKGKKDQERRYDCVEEDGVDRAFPVHHSLSSWENESEELLMESMRESN